MITLYGIPNCNTVKKARDWLSGHNVDYQFHNFKKDQLDAETLESWINQLGWEKLLNKRGMTWRKLSHEVRQDIDHDSAIEIMLNNLSIIKRPVLDHNGKLSLGFDPEQYSRLLLSK